MKIKPSCFQGVFLVVALICVLAFRASAEEDPEQATALMRFAYAGNLTAITFEIQRGSDLNARNAQGQTALHYAAMAKTNSLDVVTLLLAHGGKVNARDDCGSTPLAIACGHGDANVVRALVEAGADVNAAETVSGLGVHCAGITPLMWAAARGDEATVALLLSHGAQPSMKDSRGWNAQTYASKKGHQRVARLLRQSRCTAATLSR